MPFPTGSRGVSKLGFFNTAGLTISMQSRVPLGPGKFHIVVLVHCTSVPSSTIQSLLKHGGSVISIKILMSDTEETTSNNTSSVATPSTAAPAMANNISPIQGIHPPILWTSKGMWRTTGRPLTRHGKTMQ